MKIIPALLLKKLESRLTDALVLLDYLDYHNCRDYLDILIILNYLINWKFEKHLSLIDSLTH